MSKTQRPFRRHDRFSRQSDVLADDFFIVFTEDKVIYHFPVRRFKAVIITAFRSEFEFRLIGVIKENTIPVIAHKERNTLVKRIFYHTITRFVTIPHLIRLATTVHLSRFLTKSEEVLVTTKHFIFHLLRSFTNMAFIGIITKQKFLIFIEYLKTHRRFIHPDTQLRSKYLVTGRLFIHMNSSYLFQFFINHCKRSISSLQLPVG